MVSSEAEKKLVTFERGTTMIKGTYTKAVWIPRVLAVLYALFLMIFSFDVFGDAGVTAKEIGDFLVHSVPSFLILLLVFVTWKWPRLTGLFFILLSAGFAVYFLVTKEQEVASYYLMSLIPGAIGVIYLLCGIKKKDAA